MSADASFRASLRAIVPDFLLDVVNDSLGFAQMVTLDAIGDWLYYGVKARYPAYAPPDALGHIGNDQGIDRGPAQSDDGYRVQLRQAWDTWANAGGARTILAQLAAYFVNVATPPLRAVSNSAVWHEYNWATGRTTKTVVGTNWDWDGLARWWRGWVIIDSTDGPWTIKRWGDGGDYGDGGTWGSSATVDEWTSLKKIVGKWKPANVAARIILTFDPSALLRTNAAPPNPDGDYGDPATLAPLLINVSEVIL